MCKELIEPLARNPLIYQINTWVWLEELGQRYHTTVTLDNVPLQEWEAIAALGVDALSVAVHQVANLRRVLADQAPPSLAGLAPSLTHFRTAQQAPTWGARVDRRSGPPSRG